MALLSRFIALSGMLLLLLGVAVPARADDTLRLVEQKIKAGLLYNFIKHTAWPAGAETLPLSVCIYGDDDFEDYLRPMEGRTVNQRKVSLRRIKEVPEAGHCHVVFVSSKEKRDWKALHRFLQAKPVLTVSDYEGFAQSGGMIAFHEKDKRIGATFNLEAFAQAGLHISESLLELSGVEQLPAARRAP